MLPLLVPRSVVLARLHAAAHPQPRLLPYEAVVDALHESAAATKAAGLAAHAAALAAAHPKNELAAFYTAAAAVVPVLFLALLYQSNLLSLPAAQARARRVAVALAIVVSLLAFVAETAALAALATQRTTHAREGIVAAGLVGLGVYLVLALAGDLTDRLPKAERHRWRICVLAGAIVGLGGFYLWLSIAVGKPGLFEA